MKAGAAQVKTPRVQGGNLQGGTRAAVAGDLSADIAAAMAWWREAGVDLAYADEPQQWLRAQVPEDGDHGNVGPAPAAARAPERTPEPPRARIGGDRAAWPTDLAAFQSWWLSEPSLDPGPLGERAAPRGGAEPALMLLTPEPEDGDTAHLLAAMLAAMGLTAGEAYVASVLPRRTPMADWADLAAGGIGAVLAHHIALVRPRRLIAFGSGILPLLGHDTAQNAAPLEFFNHDGATRLLPVPLLAARDPWSLLDRPGARASFWRSWLDWTAT